MSGPVRGMARRLCALARFLTLPHREEWARAMAVECDSIPEDRTALGFAAGCALAAGQQLVFSAAFVKAAMLAGLAGLAMAAGRAAVSLPVGDGAAVAVFGGLCALFAGTFAVLLWRGAGGLSSISCAMVPASLVTAVCLSSAEMGEPPAALALYRALSVEGVCIWSALLVGALVVRRYSRVEA